MGIFSNEDFYYPVDIEDQRFDDSDYLNDEYDEKEKEEDEDDE